MSSQAAKALLEAVAGYTGGGVGRSARIGTVDPSYTSGLVKVTFDGETTLSVKGYAWLGAYTPAASDRVALLPVGTSWLILGKIRTS